MTIARKLLEKKLEEAKRDEALRLVVTVPQGKAPSVKTLLISMGYVWDAYEDTSLSDIEYILENRAMAVQVTLSSKCIRILSCAPLAAEARSLVIPMSDIQCRIQCAAIHFDTGMKTVHAPFNIESGIVVAGLHHHNCFAAMKDLDISPPEKMNWPEEQGFLTNDNLFVNRIAAAKIAYEAGQIRELKEQLYSEDLY